MAKTDKSQVKEVKAFARYIHVSPQKMRLVANLIRKAPVDVALEQLKFSSKNAALPIAKAINSAIANAVHNFEMDRDSLYVKAITIDGGPVFKGYAPRAQGRAFVIRKRTSHINVVLESRQRSGSKPNRSIFNRTKADKGEKVVNEPTEEGKVEENRNAPKQAPKSDEKMKQQKVNLKRRLFNRKSGG